MERSPLEMIRESSLFGGFVHIILSKENVEGGSHRTNDEAQSFIRFLTFELTCSFGSIYSSLGNII